MIAHIRQTLFRLADATTITGKIMGIILGLTLFFGIGFTLYLNISTRLLLVDQLESRGLTIAAGVATRALEPVLMGNEFAIHGLLEETTRLNADVRYILLISPRGEVLGDTFRRRIPVGLVEANSVGADGASNTVPISTDEGMVRDIAIPLLGGRGGAVRVGMSERSLEAELARQTLQLLVATAVASLIGIWAAYRFSHILARPIQALVSGTKRVAAGDLSVQVPVFAGDDLGQLAGAFNTMTAQIAHQYTEISRFSQQVLRDNADLVALQTITARLNRLHHIGTMPQVASRLINNRLEVLAATVLVWNTDSETWSPTAPSGVEGLLSEAIRERRVLVAGPRAVIPLLAAERLIGALVVQDEPGRLATERYQNFLGSIGNHLSIALDNARLLSELTDKQQVLTHLFDRAVSAQEEERRRISRELHDETSQSLTSLMLGLRSVEEADSPEALHHHLQALRERVRTALDSVHQMARRLRPLALDDLGLAAALKRHRQELVVQTGLDIDLDVDGLGDDRLPSDVETAVYRIVQEALTNAIRHANANQISIVVERQSGMVIAMIEDDGAGFDLSAASATTRLGLSGMRERAHLVGGTLTVETSPGSGTMVCLRIPEAQSGRRTADADSDTPGR